MPSPVGHALAGAAIAWIAEALPPTRAERHTAQPPRNADHGRPEGGRDLGRYFWSCVILAASPDIDLALPLAHRTVTHSLAAVVAIALVMIVAGAVTGKVTLKFGAACVVAYASHLLLDWLQTDPTPPFGIQLLWPFSPTWFISGWELFRATERRHLFEAATIRRNVLALMQEIAVLAPVAAAAWLVRVEALARLPSEVARRNQPLQ
jgi:hypothetical protein